MAPNAAFAAGAGDVKMVYVGSGAGGWWCAISNNKNKINLPDQKSNICEYVSLTVGVPLPG